MDLISTPNFNPNGQTQDIVKPLQTERDFQRHDFIMNAADYRNRPMKMLGFTPMGRMWPLYATTYCIGLSWTFFPAFSVVGGWRYNTLAAFGNSKNSRLAGNGYTAQTQSVLIGVSLKLPFLPFGLHATVTGTISTESYTAIDGYDLDEIVNLNLYTMFKKHLIGTPDGRDFIEAKSAEADTFHADSMRQCKTCRERDIPASKENIEEGWYEAIKDMDPKVFDIVASVMLPLSQIEREARQLDTVLHIEERLDLNNRSRFELGHINSNAVPPLRTIYHEYKFVDPDGQEQQGKEALRIMRRKREPGGHQAGTPLDTFYYRASEYEGMIRHLAFRMLYQFSELVAESLFFGPKFDAVDHYEIHPGEIKPIGHSWWEWFPGVKERNLDRITKFLLHAENTNIRFLSDSGTINNAESQRCIEAERWFGLDSSGRENAEKLAFGESVDVRIDGVWDEKNADALIYKAHFPGELDKQGNVEEDSFDVMLKDGRMLYNLSREDLRLKNKRERSTGETGKSGIRVYGRLLCGLLTNYDKSEFVELPIPSHDDTECYADWAQENARACMEAGSHRGIFGRKLKRHRNKCTWLGTGVPSSQNPSGEVEPIKEEELEKVYGSATEINGSNRPPTDWEMTQYESLLYDLQMGVCTTCRPEDAHSEIVEFEDLALGKEEGSIFSRSGDREKFECIPLSCT
eukprot:g45.t1